MAHIAVIGRIPNDDEDTCLFYEGLSRSKAIKQFEKDMYECVDDSRGKKKFNRNEFGTAVYVNHVLESKSEIKTLEERRNKWNSPLNR